MTLSAIDPSVRQAARAWGRNSAFNFLSRFMLAALFVTVIVAMGLVDALLQYLEAPRWMVNPGSVFVLGLLLGCSAVFGVANHWRWRLYRFVVRNVWWPYLRAYRYIKPR